MAKQSSKPNKTELKVVSPDTSTKLTNIQAVELFNLSVQIRAGQDVSHSDKISATRNFLTLLSFKKEHEEIIKTISDEFKGKYKEQIESLQAETDTDKQKKDEQDLMKLQQEYFEKDLLLAEFCKKELSVILEPLSIDICADEAICPAMTLVTLSDLQLLNC